MGNESKLVAKKAYVYRRIINSLKFLARQKGFLEKCDDWQTRDSRGLLGDIDDIAFKARLDPVNCRGAPPRSAGVRLGRRAARSSRDRV